jgi:adenylosuccinate synthase
MFASAFPLGFSNVFFEGAQGLLLDQDHPYFPYVTHSKTGLANVRTLCEEAKIFELTAVYVTRAYLTRHGAGPFPTEDPTLSYPDLTTVPNPFQKKLRFGALDPAGLQQRIRADRKDGGQLAGFTHVALTCLDQVPNPLQVYEVLRSCVPVKYASYGPTRATLDAF